MNSQQNSLFEQLGGETAFDAVVDLFYHKVMSDEFLMDFFAETNMTQQKKHQKNFLIYACGGPNNYKGRDLRSAHLKFSLDDSHFDAIMVHLSSTLKELGVSDELIKIVADKVETLRPEVLNR